MKDYKVKIGTVSILSDTVAMITANKGIQVDKENFREVLDLLERLAPNGVKMIINKYHSYDVSFDIMMDCPKLSLIKATAIVFHTKASRIAAQTQTVVADGNTHQSIRLFSGENGIAEAKRWLDSLPD